MGKLTDKAKKTTSKMEQTDQKKKSPLSRPQVRRQETDRGRGIKMELRRSVIYLNKIKGRK